MVLLAAACCPFPCPVLQMSVLDASGTGHLLIPIHSMWKLTIVNGVAHVRGFMFHDYLSTRGMHDRINVTDQAPKEYYLR